MVPEKQPRLISGLHTCTHMHLHKQHMHTQKKTLKTTASVPGMSTIFLLLFHQLLLSMEAKVSLNRIGSLNQEYLKPKAEEE